MAYSTNPLYQSLMDQYLGNTNYVSGGGEVSAPAMNANPDQQGAPGGGGGTPTGDGLGTGLYPLADQPGAGGGLGKFLRKQKNTRALGYQTLYQILASQGATDPRLMNRTLAGVSRGTEAGQQGLAAGMASRGLGDSGLAAALSSAIQQGGTETKAGVLAEEAQRQEERKRQDLGLLLSLIVGPQLTMRGQDQALRAAQARGGGAGTDWMGLIGSLLNTGSNLYNGRERKQSSGRDQYGGGYPSGGNAGNGGASGGIM